MTTGTDHRLKFAQALKELAAIAEREGWELGNGSLVSALLSSIAYELEDQAEEELR